jgi:hypothetical protein
MKSVFLRGRSKVGKAKFSTVVIEKREAEKTAPKREG